jgi:hypothetical protein
MFVEDQLVAATTGVAYIVSQIGYQSKQQASST